MVLTEEPTREGAESLVGGGGAGQGRERQDWSRTAWRITMD